MKHVVTPSARARERVTARWPQQKPLEGPSQQGFYLIKLISGFPVPYVVYLLALCLPLNESLCEIISWLLIACVGVYIFADRLSRQHELRFYRVGGDLPLAVFVLITLVAGTMTYSLLEYGWQQLQWVFLIYGLTYMWELFPGLNRWWSFLGWLTLGTVAYGLAQFFGGLSYVDQHFKLQSTAWATFASPALFAAWLATAAPWLASLISHGAEPVNMRERMQAWGYRAAMLLGGLALYATGEAELWIAAAVGVGAAVILNYRKWTWQLLAPVFLFVVLHQFQLRPEGDAGRAAILKTSMQRHYEIWQNHLWLGDPATPLFEANNSYLLLLSRSGILGGAAFLLFAVGSLLAAYRLYGLIPKAHDAHRTIVAGIFGGLFATYAPGVYIATLWQMPFAFLFAMMVATLSYMSEHYDRGLVSDDACL